MLYLLLSVAPPLCLLVSPTLDVGSDIRGQNMVYQNARQQGMFTFKWRAPFHCTFRQVYSTCYLIRERTCLSPYVEPLLTRYLPERHVLVSHHDVDMEAQSATWFCAFPISFLVDQIQAPTLAAASLIIS